MKLILKYSWLPFLLLTKISFCQDTIISINNNWLTIITNNSLEKKSVEGSFQYAPAGFALYFSKTDSLNVPFLVFVPKNYASSKPHSLIVYLHGGVVSLDSFQYKNASFASNEPIFSIGERYNEIVLYPFGRKDFGWVKQPAAFENIITEISQVEQLYNIEKKAVFLGGMSNGGSATFWFITNYPKIFKAFYAFSAMPELFQSDINFKNITADKPLYSINAKDDEGYAFDKVKTIYEQHKSEAPGWHFDSVENGNHGFIYDDTGLVAMNHLFEQLNWFAGTQKVTCDSLQQILSQVDEDDQKFRNQMDFVREKFGGKSPEMRNLMKDMSIADSLNLVIVKKIVKQYGWLGADDIGITANKALFMVIQHNDLKTQEQYLPIIKDAAKHGKADVKELAMLEDRVALREGREQIYGSQLSWNYAANTYQFFPIIDPDNLDKRRAAAGLMPYADYLSGFDIKWNLEQYKKDLPEIENRFKAKK